MSHSFAGGDMGWVTWTSRAWDLSPERVEATGRVRWVKGKKGKGLASEKEALLLWC